ncbi:hypothetical protein SFR_7019 (plasmid) [Streptomyces sp. FR-008]|nr:hypothetical protein SFR_7019 [Streptomyces sp. FR-008]
MPGTPTDTHGSSAETTLAEHYEGCHEHQRRDDPLLP